MRLFASRQLVAVCAILAVLAISTTAQAQRGPAAEALAERARQMRTKPPFPPGLAEGRLIQQMDDEGEELDLSDEKRSALDAAVEDLRTAEDAHREKGQEAAKQLNDLLNENSPDQKTVLEVSKRIGELSSEIRARRLESTLQFRSLLTPEQLEAYMKIRAQLPPPREGARRPRR